MNCFCICFWHLKFLWVKDFMWVTRINYQVENGRDTWTRTFWQNIACNFAVRRRHTDMGGDAGRQQNSRSVGATCNHHHCKQHFFFFYLRSLMTSFLSSITIPRQSVTLRTLYILLHCVMLLHHSVTLRTLYAIILRNVCLFFVCFLHCIMLHSWVTLAETSYYEFSYSFVNSLRPSDAYMRQWTNHHWSR